MKNVEKLVQEHRKLIEAEARKNAQFVPLIVVEAEAYRLAHEAALSYDEKSGVKFSTHLTNQLKKLQRFSTTYGGSVRVSENAQFKIQRINTAEKHLHEELGRPPTAAELADATGLGLPAVGNLLKKRKKEVDLTNLSYTPVFVDDGRLDDWIHFVYHDLSSTDKLIFEYRTGFGGKPILTEEEISKKLHIPADIVKLRVRLISQKLNEKKF